MSTDTEAIPQDSAFLPAPLWASTLASLTDHRERLERQLGLAEDLERSGDVEGAVAIAGAAAALAGTQHPGISASPRLEALLERIAADRLPPLTRRTAAAAEPRRVLHVVTEVYDTGGHTRVLWRWMDREPDSVHTVVASGQVGAVPGALVDLTRERGGDLIRLNPEAPALERAAEVRRLAGDADVVVVHQHPQDPLPTLALASAPQRPPVVMFNHADHMFWVGASISDVLLSIRALGPAVDRGIPAERHIVRPFPVSGSDSNGRDPAQPVSAEERAAARASILAQLGWPDDTVLVATVGSPFKYEGPPGSSLRDLVEPVLAEFPSTRLLAVGPEDAGPWAQMRERTGGRAAAVGSTPNVLPILAAGDVYLDSRPQGGQATVAEAAASGLPALTYAASAVEAEVICPDPLYGATVVEGVEPYRDALRALLANADHRRSMGDAARAAVARADAGWGDAVGDAYALAARLGPMSVDQLGPPPERPHVRDALVKHSVVIARQLAPEAIDRITDVVELSARSPAVRRLFSWGNGDTGYPKQRLRYGSAFAAPDADPAVLRALIDEFRRLARAGVAQTFVLAMRPDDVDSAVPTLEAAIGSGDDIDVDLQIVEDPQAARPPDALEVVTEMPPGADPAMTLVMAQP